MRPRSHWYDLQGAREVNPATGESLTPSGETIRSRGVPAWIIAEMRADADKRHRVTVAAMFRAEIIAAHETECAEAMAAIVAGYTLPDAARSLDRIAVLQEVRASIGPIPPPIKYHVPYVQITHDDGVRLRYPVRCF